MYVLREETPVARKKHVCDLCGCTIEPGTKYLHQVNTYEGICNIKTHLECANYMRSHQFDEDEVGPDYLADSCMDELTDIMGSRDNAREFMRSHSIYECVKFIQEHGNS